MVKTCLITESAFLHEFELKLLSPPKFSRALISRAFSQPITGRLLQRVAIAAIAVMPFSTSFAQDPNKELVSEPVDYNRDIRPILSNNCFFCHGFDENQRKADLRLDTFAGATENDAVVPGDAEASQTFERIHSDDPEMVMPPANSAYSLTDKQKDLLKRWIDQGGDYQEHWAYRKLERPTVPETSIEKSANPIDAFLHRTWKEEKITPVAKATPREVLRRLSFDLRGIPPTMEQVRSFQKDPSSAAFKKFVDQWTNSIEYAEHQGLLWLDLVRWADSSGMVSDEPIASGQYRKYVIEAFQANMPFDQFTREQLAGDLLENVTEKTLIASGYNRLVKTNSEAGVIEKEALHALKGEHVRAIGTVWLGATTGCAECHDHKYDPITAKDYYSMAAFFDDLIEIGVYEPGDHRFPLRYIYDDPSLADQDKQLAAEIDRLRKTLYETPASPEAIKAWEDRTLTEFKEVPKRADFAWMPKVLPPARISSGNFEQTGDGRLVTAADNEIKLHIASEVMTGHLKQVGGKDPVNYVSLTLDKSNPPKALGVQIIHGAYQRHGWLPDYFTTYYWGEESALETMQTTVANNKRVVHLGPLPESGKAVRLEIPHDKLMKTKYEAVGMGWIQLGGSVTWGDCGFNLTGASNFKINLAQSTMQRWWELPYNRDDRKSTMTLVLDALKLDADKRRTVHNDVIRYAYQEAQSPKIVSELQSAWRAISRLRQSANATALISKTGPLKETKLRNRGNFMDETGPTLDPAVPEFLATLETDGRADRLDLANWLTDKDNPLSPRVFVNRLWHQFYGRGLSETLEDAGNQGDWPSHPQLLDYLAAEFVESGWDVRHMIRLMVSAEAYQLSSKPTQQIVESDPANRLHARQSRHRHSAEEIRDTALLAADLLQPTKEIPQESFFPYQPNSYWVKSNKIMYGSRYLTWDTDQGASQYQRSLYTFWKRQNPHPSMLAFDAPTRQECTAKRSVTNTPGQALALLNDPAYVEAARVMAERILTSAEAINDKSRIMMLFEFALQRLPSRSESARLEKMVNETTEHFAEHPEDAKNLLTVGQWPVNEELPAAEFAAWTSACRVILNLHEFITRS